MKNSEKLLNELKENMKNMKVSKEEIAKAMDGIGKEIIAERKRAKRLFIFGVLASVTGVATLAYYKFKK